MACLFVQQLDSFQHLLQYLQQTGNYLEHFRFGFEFGFYKDRGRVMKIGRYVLK